METLFGTDGVRGIANKELTPELAFDLGRAGSLVLAKETQGQRPRVLMGKDTRISGDMLEAALTAGICASGADVLSAGIIPTPAVAYLTRKYQASCGIVISASHNPAQDNGIKFFGPDGHKLPDSIEEEIEKLVKADPKNLPRVNGDEVGRVYEVREAFNNYVKYLLDCYEGEYPFREISLVVDCAHGAAYMVAPEVWKSLGAKVNIINDQPNGININLRCGSTYTQGLKQAVISLKADFGIAYDGDADRCIIIDEKGNELDGDNIILICALDLHRQGLLKPSLAVATIVSNTGLNMALGREGIKVINSDVGDRYVLEKMMESGAIIGGEPSGHTIFARHSTTGDGILTSIKIAEAFIRYKLPLSELASEMEKLPQLTVNFKINNKKEILSHDLVQQAIREAENKLGEWGKLVIRPSGTEPLVRLMAQGRDQLLIEEIINDIIKTLEEVQRKYYV